MKKLTLKKKYNDLVNNKELTTKQKLQTILDDTVNHFTSENRCTKGTGCLYSPYSDPTGNKNSEGCAVGRLFTKQSAMKLDCFILSTGFIDSIAIEEAEIIPPFIKENASFFRNLQALHDDEMSWDENGLLEKGKQRVEEITEKFLS